MPAYSFQEKSPAYPLIFYPTRLLEPTLLLERQEYKKLYFGANVCKIKSWHFFSKPVNMKLEYSFEN
jgi:hypothetical protein